MPESIISHSSPEIGEDEIDALVACVRSLQIKGGKRLKDLEDHIKNDLSYAGAVGTTTGSHAIHLALRASFPKKGANIGLPSYLCRSVFDAVVLAGHRPFLFDINPNYFSISLEDLIKSSLDAVIVPHMFGIRAPIENLQSAGIPIIEDCAQRLAPINIALTESKAFIKILSFEATKLVTCGEGGMLLSDDLEVIKQSKRLRDAPYDLVEPALHLPLTDIQAVLALVQWKRLSHFLEMRHKLALYYLGTIGKEYPEKIPPAMRAKDTFHFRFLLWVDDPDFLIKKGAEQGINFRRPIAPLPLHKLFNCEGSFPSTEIAFSNLLSIPIYPNLTLTEAERVTDCVCKLLGES